MLLCCSSWPDGDTPGDASVSALNGQTSDPTGERWTTETRVRSAARSAVDQDVVIIILRRAVVSFCAWPLFRVAFRQPNGRRSRATHARPTRRRAGRDGVEKRIPPRFFSILIFRRVVFCTGSSGGKKKTER